MRSSLLAILNAALAVASKHATTQTAGSETSRSYFARAKLLLGSPLETATPSHIQCLSLMGYYLLGENRRDAAYSYIRLAGHIAIANGFHQSWMTGEMEKRQFWTVYVLDRFLSCLLGRPNMISDDDIGVDLPKDEPGLPSAEGLRANVQLARILGDSVRKIYGNGGNRRGNALGLTHIHSSLGELQRWESELPVSFSASRCSTPGTIRDLLSLHMNYNQSIILLTRPVLFSAVKHAVARCFVPSHPDPKKKAPDEHLLGVCTTAAQKNAKLFYQLWETASNDPSGLTMIDYHNSFNAALILELVCLHIWPNSVPHPSIVEDTLHVKNITDILRIAGENGNDFAQDCFTVLVDLRQLVEKLAQELALLLVCGEGGQETTTLDFQYNISHNVDEGSNNNIVQSADSDARHEQPNFNSVLESFNLPDIEYRGMFDEFTSWLQDDIF